MSVAENIKKYRALVPSGVEIVAVSKFHPDSLIMEAYEAGQRLFGESRVQEFVMKYDQLPKDIKWHFIGHLQTNKAKQLIGKTSMIESVDSVKLIELLEKESAATGVVTDVLLQIHVAQEEAKFGFYPEEILDLIGKAPISELKNVRVCGLMGMATNTEDYHRVREDFKKLHSLYEVIKATCMKDNPDFKYLSMGMSGDWQMAVDEGSNIVRIGSAIFGERHY